MGAGEHISVLSRFSDCQKSPQDAKAHFYAKVKLRV